MEIEQRSRCGDLQIDTIVEKHHQQSRVSIVDGKINLLTPFKDQLKTITADNGKQFSLHEHAAQALDIDWYFADPYSAWQTGANENTNNLFRQYINKGSDLNR